MGWQWRQLDHMQIICTSLQTDNHASTSVFITQFLQAGCPSCRPTNDFKALKATSAFRLWRRRQSSPQLCYLHRLHTFSRGKTKRPINLWSDIRKQPERTTYPVKTPRRQPFLQVCYVAACQKISSLHYWPDASLVMVALCNRADHYIFAL